MMMKLSAFGDEIGEDLDTQLTLMRSMGILGLDLRSAFGKNVLQLTYGEVVKVRDTVRAHGMHIESIGSPVNKVAFSPDGHAAEMAKLDRAIYIAHAVNTRRVRIFSPETSPHGDVTAWPEVRDWLAPMAKLAEEKDVVLMHENDWRFFGAWPAHSKLIFETFGGPHFRAVYDPGNAVELGWHTMSDWFPWLLPHLVAIHVKDRKFGATEFTYAGQGDGEIQELFAFLSKNNWEGTLTLEPHSEPRTAEGEGVDAFGAANSALHAVMDRAQVHSAGLW